MSTAVAESGVADSAEVQTAESKARRKSIRDRTKELKKIKKKERAAKKVIIEKQKELEKVEIRLEWRIVMGDILPQKKKDTYLITDVTRRNIWFEDNFIYEKIKELEPEHFFHPPEKYALKWQPPGSLFKLIVPLDNPQTQENALLIMADLKHADQKKVLFFFSPIDPTMDLYAPKVHPSSLVSYRTKNEVLRKLSEFFLSDKIDVDEIQAIFTCDQRVWNSSLYNLLPPDEQVFHSYLNEVPDIEDTNKTLSKSYIDGDINLEQYEALRYPERHKQKEVESMEYPLPFDKDTCRICYQPECGIVKCHTCANMVCADCFRTVFVDENSAEKTTFLMMHQKYCMKLGELPEIVPLVVEEPGYLREFRNTSRLAVLDRLIPKPKVEEFEEEAEISSDEEEREYRRKQREDRMRRALLEQERLRKQNPTELQELREQFMARKKRLEHLKKEVLELNAKLAEPGHTDQFVARTERLKEERLEKLERQVQKPMLQIEAEAEALCLEGEFVEELMRQLRLAKKEIRKLTFVRGGEGGGGEGGPLPQSESYDSLQQQS